MEARRRSRVRAVRRPHPLVRRVRDPRRAGRARRTASYASDHEDVRLRPHASTSTTARSCASSSVDDADAVAACRRREPRAPPAVDAVGRRAVGRSRVPARPAPRSCRTSRRAARSGSTASFAADDTRVLGSFGLMTRRGPRHARDRLLAPRRRDRPGPRDARGRGAHRRRARHRRRRPRVHLLRRGERRAARPSRGGSGYTLLRTEKRRPEAPGERGRLMIWALDWPRRRDHRSRESLRAQCAK